MPLKWPSSRELYCYEYCICSKWSRFAEEAGVDLYAIVDAIRVRPTHNNLMYPGVGVGGYCLTKDPLLRFTRTAF